MEAAVEHAEDASSVVSGLVSFVPSVMARLFRCWHANMSQPFSRGAETYRTCVACGGGGRFDLEHRKMVGSFYYPERNFVLYDETP